MKCQVFSFLLFAILFFRIISCLEYPLNEWKQVERSAGDEEVNFTLALKLNNLDVLDELTIRLTTPGSSEFRQWKTIHELNEITKPDPTGVSNILSWLKVNHLKGIHYGDFITVSGSVVDVEYAFKVEYYKFINIIHTFQPITIHRSIHHPIIPEKFRDIIVFITGVSNFPYPTKKTSNRKKTIDSSVDDYYIVPQTLREQYSVPANYTATNPKSSQGVVEFGTFAGISQSDLSKFMELTNGNTSSQLSYTVGNFVNITADMESNLDVQYIMSMAPGVSTSFYVVNGWIYDFTSLVQVRAFEGQPNPFIFSLSYAWAEGGQCEVTKPGTGCGQIGGGNSTTYVENTNVGFQKIGLMGISVFACSGDAGAATKENIHCHHRRNPIQADYPASSNYVTAVGGTMYKSAQVLSNGNSPPFCNQSNVTCAGIGDEVVCQLPDAEITSGGGFSDVALTPYWQQYQVQSYLTSGALLPPATQFNSTGRAYPDISALAHRFMVVGNNEILSVDGTSASSPLVAGIFALINDHIFNSGGNSLGFLNPALYNVASSSSVAQDVIYGNNTTTEGEDIFRREPCTTSGYGATYGWDAVSGFGSPNFNELLNSLQSLK